MPRYFLLILALGTILVGLPRPASAASTPPTVEILDRNQALLTRIVDGNPLALKVTLPQALPSATTIDFRLEGYDQPLAGCTVAAGQSTCTSDLLPTLGWAWDTTGRRYSQRVIRAEIQGQTVAASAPLAVEARPVVLVHGFNSNWNAWNAYLGPDGFLAEVGLQGYAVGDGQVEGVMNTGSLSAPLEHTNSIAENAVILGQYIHRVQELTHADYVDVVVHSMGGMITRYYLDRIMTDRNVAQLIILGTPMGGSACAMLPASLGLLLPATVEIQPGYMLNVFNPTITHRREVPFHALAGNKLLEAVQSPCTAVPSDLVVTIDSVKAISMPVQEIALLHTELNTNPEVFRDFVSPLLRAPAGPGWEVTDPAPIPPGPALQFSQIFTGHVQPGAVQTVTIPIEPGVTVATFALYDTSRSLTTQVTGASGKTIQLDPVKNGLVRVTDPASLVYLGYGFAQPKPGRWIVTVLPTADTPATGADYAITALYNGGAVLSASLSSSVPAVRETITLRAALDLNGSALPLLSAQAKLRTPDGPNLIYPMTIQDNQARLTLSAEQSGLHSLEVDVTAQTEAGLAVDRAAFLSFDAQPDSTDVQRTRWIVGVTLAGVAAVVAGGAVQPGRSNDPEH